MSDRHCSGYRSTTYQQAPHSLPNDNEHFGPGRNWCRDCYRAYARDWRARRAGTRVRAIATGTLRARPRVMDGVASLERILRLAGYSSVVKAVAAHAVFLDPAVVAQTGGQPLFPTVRDANRRRQFDFLADGRRVLLDDNATPTDAFLWSAGLKKGADVQFNHVWTASRDVGSYTALWNICATPAFLAKTTDGANHPDVIEALHFHAYRLYGFLPEGTPQPTQPAGYDHLVWAPHPQPTRNLEVELRQRMRLSPKSSAAIASREIGWLFSDWTPDPTV